MADVVSIKLVGCAYIRGRRSNGWTSIELDNGQSIFAKEGIGFEEACRIAEQQGHDASSMRKNIEHWVQTGQFLEKSDASHSRTTSLSKGR